MLMLLGLLFACVTEVECLCVDTGDTDTDVSTGDTDTAACECD